MATEEKVGIVDGYYAKIGVAAIRLTDGALQVGAFVGKVCAMIFFMMLVRWTLPRFRYDQAMRLGWLGLFPLSVLNIVLTGLLLLAWGAA